MHAPEQALKKFLKQSMHITLAASAMKAQS
jgi:hypothetical protein